MDVLRSPLLATLGLMVIAGTPHALAQSVDIPLNLDQASGGVILTINVGIGGASPRPYLFDTGSNIFNAFYSTAAFGGIAASNPSLPRNLTFNYGDAGNPSASYFGNLVLAPSLSFYSALSGSAAATLSAQGGPGFVVSAVQSAVNGNGDPITPPLKAHGAFKGYYGIFGAGTVVQTETSGHLSSAVGGVLGQAVVSGTTAGYVVSANGQPLSSLNAGIAGQFANGPQVGQSVTPCSPCVMEGLTPALRAQFPIANTIVATSAPGKPFPNSGYPSFNDFSGLAKVTVGLPGQPSATYQQRTLFDTGTATVQIYNTGVSQPLDPLPAGSTVTVAGASAGAGTTTFVAAYSGSGKPASPYAVSLGDTVNESYLGISFFLSNSVLYDLAGKAVAYSPNFVTDADVSTASGPLVVDSSSVPLGLAGVISGSGGISVGAGGSATLSGTNTYTGATAITGAGAYLALVGPGDISPSSGVGVSSGGLFDISGVSSVTGTATIASLSGDANGAVNLGANVLALSNASGSFAGTLAGSGGLALLGGTETLTGTNLYTGATYVGGGTLIVNGSIAASGATVVAASGALTGNGAVGSLYVQAGGVFAPGSPTAGGAMTVAGNLTLAPGATYMVGLGPTDSNVARVSGGATLTGANVIATLAPGANPARQYTILTAAGGFGGTTFASVVSSVGPNYADSLSYGAGAAYLNVQATLGAGSALLPNARVVASGVSAAFNGGAPLPPGLAALFGLTGPGLAASLGQIDGEAATGAERTVFGIGDAFLGLVLDPHVADRGAAGASSSPWTAWGAAYGGGANGNGDAAAGGARISGGAFGSAAGADYRVAPGAIVGFALGGAGANWGLADGLGSGRASAIQAAVYGIARGGAGYLAGALDVSNQWLTTNRSALGDRLTADFTGQSFGARLESGYRLGLGPAFGATPYAAAQVQNFLTPAYGETDTTGAGYGLSYGAAHAADARTELGARFDLAASGGGAPVDLFGRIAWAHDFVGAPSASASFAALPGSAFTVFGAPIPANSALVSAGARVGLGKGWAMQAKFEGQFATGAANFGGSGALVYSW